MNGLSIGNSFSQNAHAFLPGMMKADGCDDFMLCNLYIPACSLETHWENMKSEKEAYEYQIYLPGETVMNKADGVALFEPLEDEDWDVVTLQQVSSLAGIEESWSPFIEELTAYVRMTAPKAKVLIHQTWAYDKGTLNEGFSKYSNSTDTMFDCINRAVEIAKINADVDGVIPCGLAFQFARQTKLKDMLTAPDGYHASVLGCYLAGACFYEAVTGKSITENGLRIEGVPDEYIKLLALCAHSAVEKYNNT